MPKLYENLVPKMTKKRYSFRPRSVQPYETDKAYIKAMTMRKKNEHQCKCCVADNVKLANACAVSMLAFVTDTLP